MGPQPRPHGEGSGLLGPTLVRAADNRPWLEPQCPFAHDREAELSPPTATSKSSASSEQAAVREAVRRDKGLSTGAPSGLGHEKAMKAARRALRRK